jgi:hypothetical protein
MCKQFVKSVAILVTVLVFSCYAYDFALWLCCFSYALKADLKTLAFSKYLKESELSQSVSVLDSGTVIKGTAKSTTNCILRSVQKVCVHDIVWNASHTVQTVVFSIDHWADPNSITGSQFSWLPLFLSIIFDKVCWILIDLVQKTDVKLLECVLLKNHQSIVSSQHLRQIQCLVFQIVVQWHIFHHKLMHIDQEHFTSMEHNFLR